MAPFFIGAMLQGTDSLVVGIDFGLIEFLSWAFLWNLTI